MASADLWEGAGRWWLWGRLAWQDIRLRYRRSALGPLWITLSMALTVLSLGILYSKLFNLPLDKFLPFLCLGLLGWNLISSLVSESCTTFTSYSGIIRQTRVPFTVCALRVVWRNFLIFFHNIVVYVALAIYLGEWPGWNILLSLLSLCFIFINAVWSGILIGMLAARFRDVPPIIASLLQLAFFVTPILWPPSQLGAAARYLVLNPFYPFLATFREPLLGQVPDPFLWWVIIAMTVFGSGFTFILFARFRGRICYWL